MTQGLPQKKFILCVGFDPRLWFEAFLSSVEVKYIDIDMDVIMELDESHAPQIVLCGQPTAELPAAELAQLLRMKFQNTPIYLFVNSDQRLNRKDIIKNGFNDLFFMPVDKEIARDALIKSLSSDANKKIYKPIKVIDLQTDIPLDFDTFVHLPLNNKTIKFTSSGDVIRSKVNRLLHKSESKLLIDQLDTQKFYSFTAKVLRATNNNTSMSETEKQEKLKSAIRTVVSDLFSDTIVGTDSGKKIVDECQSIVKNFVLDSKVGKIYDKILAKKSESADSYSHYTNVSTFASLFAIGLGLKNVEEVAIAGLLHDLGLTKIPYEIQQKLESQMTPQEKSIYEKHVEYSISIVQERKLVLPELVYKIIWQHHERFNGKGYPKQLPGNRICQEAQVLAFADQFDYLIAPAADRTALTPLKAAKYFKTFLTRPDDCPIDPALLKKILSLFPLDEADESPTDSTKSPRSKAS